MTTQISDGVFFEGTQFALCGCNGNELFEPTRYGLIPTMASTACYRGWMSEYSVAEELLLQDLYVFHDAGLPAKNRRPNGPTINSIPPISPNSLCGFNCLYKDLNLPIPFTGGLLLGDGFVKQSGFNMGFHPYWRYESVIELIFENGKLSRAEDKSSIALEVRNKHLVSGVLGINEIVGDKEVTRWIEQSFSLSYNLVPNKRTAIN
jgi:hypothetical protein